MNQDSRPSVMTMGPKRQTLAAPSGFRRSLQRMQGEDPDLELRRLSFRPRLSLRGSSLRSLATAETASSSTERLYGPQSWIATPSDTAGSETAATRRRRRDSGSIVNSFIRVYEDVPESAEVLSLSSARRSRRTPHNGSDKCHSIDATTTSNSQTLNGFALVLLVVGLMMAAFLLMIDSTILVTVG